MQFDLPKEKTSIIKAIGVGGGGSNAVNHMFKQGIKDVDFIVCNTDRQVLDASPVSLKIQLGATLTEGLGAGSLPEMGKKAAMENEEEIRKSLANTKMLFITAGMGGGTGTGAAPVIAQIAREMGILTVSICTLPFSWEGKLRRKQAESGLSELKKYSDSVLIILNDKLREIYHNLKVKEAFAHADNVLTSAARCIAELINVALTINVDFNDVRRVMENSGVAIMGSATASGEGRALKSVTQALNSPLLNDNDIHGARYVLVSITCGEGKDELTMDELAEITDYIQEASGQTAEMIKGYGTDATLGDKVSVTIIASGFERNANEFGFATPNQPEIKMIHLEENTSAQNGEGKDNKSPKDEKQVEFSNLTKPTLKSDIVDDKKENQAVSAAEKKKQEILAELSRIEQQSIEVKSAINSKTKEKKDNTPALNEEGRAKTKNILTPNEFVAPKPPIGRIGGTKTTDVSNPDGDNGNTVTPMHNIEQNNTDDESLPKPFIIIKEPKQKCMEFDLTDVSLTDNTQPPVQKPVQDSSSQQEPIPQVNAAGKSAGKDEMHLGITRALESTLNGRSGEAKNESASESKVTKIAEVTLNSQPPIVDNEAKAKAQEKIQKLRELSYKVKTPVGLSELEKEPAYIRKNITLGDTPHSSESEISRFTLGTDEPLSDGAGKKPALRPDNSFLHDKPD